MKNKDMNGLLGERDFYKPFKYDWAFSAYQKQNQIHWIPSEVPLADDVKDWNLKLNKEEKHLLTQVFRFFTQADKDVSDSYINKYLNMFHLPEIRMMLTSFANMESVHMEAYSLLLETVGMPEIEYSAFLNYKEMVDKHNFLDKFSIENPSEMARSMAVISGGIEGVQLFSSFAILLNFPRFGKMKGMGQLISWSSKDESLHVEALTKLFRTFVEENRSIWNDNIKKKIYEDFTIIVEQEDSFIDLCFNMGGIQGLEPSDVKQYIRFIADRRLIGLGLKGIFKVKTNPLDWLDYILNGVEFANFFESRVTEYTKGASTGDWEEDVWKPLDEQKKKVKK